MTNFNFAPSPPLEPQNPIPVSSGLPSISSGSVIDDTTRAQQINQAWQVYHGSFKKALKVKPNQFDDNVVLNFCKVIVDKDVSFLFGNDLEVEITNNAQAQEWWDTYFDATNFMSFCQKLGFSGDIAGHAVLKLIPRNPYPRLSVVDPALVSVQTLADDIETVMQYTISFAITDPKTGKPISCRQRIEATMDSTNCPISWTIYDEQQDTNSQLWITKNETVWPYIWSPIHDCQNLPFPNQYWGMSSISQDIIHLNTTLNFVLSNISRILKYHASPRLWAKGAGGIQVNADPDDITVFNHPDASLNQLAPVADLSSSQEYAKVLKDFLHELSRIPEVATGMVENLGPLSGVALQILYQPLLEKNGVRKRLYGDMLQSLITHMLELAGFGSDCKVVLHWPEVLPQDPQAEANTALSLQEAGVSKATTLKRMKFDPESEAQKSAGENAESIKQAQDSFNAGELPQNHDQQQTFGMKEKKSP